MICELVLLLLWANCIQGVYYPPAPMNNELTSVYASSTCDSNSELKIENCAEELNALGVFSHGGDQLSFGAMRTKSRTYFVHLCGAFHRFNSCLGGTYIKQACYPNEPLKSRYAVADATLDYVCGEGYESMMSNWGCYLSVAASQEIAQCEAAFLKVASRAEEMYNDYSLGAGACFALHTYVDCIRPSIELSCGTRSFQTVTKTIEKPVQVYLPFCTLSTSSALPSLLFLLSLIIVNL